MSKILIEEVFKTNGVPNVTFVEPKEYTKLVVALRSPGRGVIIEGPSGIGKTTAVESALKTLRMEGSVTKLSARRPHDIPTIKGLPTSKLAGTVLVDDFHKLDISIRNELADYMKILAETEMPETKIVVLGINRAGENLISLAPDLVNRIDIIPFESNPDFKIYELIEKGENALNAKLNVRDEIVSASQGSFYLAQMLAREVCLRAGILETADNQTTTSVSFESIRSEVWDRLSLVFRSRTEKFCRGNKMRPEGRAPYLHLLHWLAEGKEWTLSLRDAMRAHQDLRGSVGQIVDKGYLADLVRSDPEISAVLHYDDYAKQLTVEDPQFVFYIKNITWRQFALGTGFRDIDFKSRYDFALSFAGPARPIAEAIARKLEEFEVEVFYDKNEQHRIAAADVEEYLRPIYQSGARFVVALLSKDYPNRIWTKFESTAFRDRFKDGDVVPVWFSDAPPGMFDDSRRVGGYEFDTAKPADSQIDSLVESILRKLTDS